MRERLETQENIKSEKHDGDVADFHENGRLGMLGYLGNAWNSWDC